MRVFTDTIFSDTANNETIYGEWVSLEHMSLYSIQAVWTGTTITGTVKLQMTVDDALDPNVTPTATDILDSSYSITASGNTAWVAIYASYPYVRVAVTSSTANDIVMTAKIYGKGF